MKWLYTGTITVLTTALLLTGCGADSDAACAYQAEQDLDNGNYDAVIASLENNGTCNGALTQVDAWTNLAGAYMGKAGITLADLAATVIGNTDADPMAVFLETFGSLATTTGLQSMSSAAEVYGYIRLAEGFPDCNTLTGASATVVDSCFYEELVNTIETVSIMSAVMGDALEFLTTPVVSGSIDDVNVNDTADALEVTGCAIADATTPAATSQVCSTVATVAFIDAATDVTFSDGTVLTPRTFTVTDSTGVPYGNQSYYRMMDPLSPVTTSGVCGLDFLTTTTCSTDANINMAGCYPCPVIVDGAAISSTDAILTAVNDGTIAEVNATQIEQGCWDAEAAIPVAHICVVDNNLTDVELAQYMTLQ